MARPTKKTYQPVDRWFVRYQQGGVYDGPFRTRAQVEQCVERFRDEQGAEPVVTQEIIHPIADGEFISRGYHEQ